MTPPDDTATIERDLDAVDAALADDSVTHPDPVARELQELALALRADTPQPEPQFAQRLARQVEAGFPRRQSSPGGWTIGRRLLPAAGVVTLLVVVAVGLASLERESGTSDDDGGGGGGGGSVAREAAPAQDDAGGGASSSALAMPEPPGGGFVPGQRNRRIERSVSLELDVPSDEMARVAEDVTTVTNRHGGFVLSSSVDTGEDGGGGDFSLRIPAERLRPALRDLAGLAPVVSQTQEGRDVTREHVTARDRLQAARAERRSLLRRLEEADTDAEAEAIRRRLDLVAGEINGLRAQLRDLRLRTDYAVVAVSLLAGDDGSDGGGAGVGGSFDDAVGDAGDVLVASAGVLIRALAVALPLGLIALAAWLASRGFRRRRRESALA
jgi:Domain of unknown function (DUF4349)